MAKVIDMNGVPWKPEGRPEHPRENKIRLSEPNKRILAELERQAYGKRGPLFNKPIDKLIAARELRRLYYKARRDLNIDRGELENKISNLHQIKTGRRNSLGELVEYKLGRWILTDKLAKLKPEKVLEHKRFKELQKGVFGYLFAIEYLSTILDDEDPIENKIKIISNTRLWPGRLPHSDSLDDLDSAIELAFKFNELARVFANRTKLASLLTRVSKVPGSWNPTKQEFEFSGRAMSLTTSPLNHIVDQEEWPPFPSTRLINFPYMVVDRTIHVEKSEYQQLSNVADPQPAEIFGEFQTIDNAKIELSRDIHLVVAPVNDTEFEMLLESRARWELSFKDNRDEHLEFELPDLRRVMESSECFSAIEIAGKRHRIRMPSSELDWWDYCEALFPEHPDHFDFDPIAFPNQMNFDCWYPSYLRCTPEIIHHWLSTEMKPLKGCNNHCSWLAFEKSSTVTRYIQSVPGRSVEAALLEGEIDQSLQDSFDRILQSLNNRETEWREQIASREEALFAKWQNSTSIQRRDV